MAKKEKEEKQPNLMGTLAAALIFAAVTVFCVVDGICTDMLSDHLINKVILIFMILCSIGCLWLIVHIIQMIKNGNK